jgi:hypothetical protein
MLNPYFWPYFSVMVLGALVGLVELVARYRDDPVRAISQFPAIVYIAFNVGASALALYLILEIKPNWLFGNAGDLKVTPVRWIMIVSVAGTAALAFFRSSIFRAKIDDVSVPIGPALILDTLLSALDRAVDRAVAMPRSEAIRRIMNEVDFDKAQEALTSYCIALMQNLSAEESRRLANRLNEIKASPMPKDIKVLTLGLALLDAFGEDVLDKARIALQEQIKSVGPLKDQPVGQLTKLTEHLDYARTLCNLPAYCLTLGSVNKELQDQIASNIKAIDESKLSEKTKLLTLCLVLSKALGMDLVELGITQLASEISIPPPAPPPPSEPQEDG